MGIKPIETIYNGYRFRSRLEARWAVLFDALGIKYEYEPEGFELPSGNRYLPDFYLPDDDVWVEIKGGTPSDDDIDKIAEFCLHKCDITKGGSRFRLFIGAIPLPTKGSPAIPCHVYEPPSVIAKAYFQEIQKEVKKEGLEIPDYAMPAIFTSGEFVPALWICGRSSEEIFAGLSKARQARFEHGETPKVSRV